MTIPDEVVERPQRNGGSVDNIGIDVVLFELVENESCSEMGRDSTGGEPSIGIGSTGWKCLFEWEPEDTFRLLYKDSEQWRRKV